MPPIDTSALAAIFTWVWDQYGKTIVDRAGKAVWERLRWEDRALAYGQKVQRLYGKMQILGQAQPVPLEGIYTAISLLDQPTAWRRYTLEEMQADFTGRGYRYFRGGEEKNRRDALELVREGANLFILGKPGAGKTTFLKHVALKGVSGDLGRVPIFVSLKQLTDSGLSVFDYVVQEFEVCDFPDATAYLDRLLKAGKAILLFDGLDEVNVADDERARLVAGVETFTRKYDLCQRLITCRLAASDYSFTGYTYVEMADFAPEQIREFVARWFSGNDQRRERRDLFLAELEKPESEGLRELARVPLLLALLCLGFEETLKLSQQRAELYDEALDALLKKWDAGRNIRRDEVYRELTTKRKEGMLAQIAAETFDRAEYFIPGKTLARGFEAFLGRLPNMPAEIDGEIVLRAIIAQHGLFLERARDIYSFAHLTFQEYFTARYVVENEARGTLPRLIEQYDNSRYREVFLLTAAQLPDATEFFTLFIERLVADAQQRPAVAALLRQAARKAATNTGQNPQPAAVRSAYLTLALDVNNACALALEVDIDYVLAALPLSFATLPLPLSIELEMTSILSLHSVIDQFRDLRLYFAGDLDGNLPFARAIAIANALNPDIDVIVDRLRGGVLSIACDLVRELAFTLNRALTRDIALANTYLILECIALLPDHKVKLWPGVAGDFMIAAAYQSTGLGDVELGGHLFMLAELAQSASEGPDRLQLVTVTEALRPVLKALDLIFPNLGREDWDLLSQYMAGNRLLLACLDQAVVADREAIKDRLLLLPDA